MAGRLVVNDDKYELVCVINDRKVSASVEARKLLVDFLREDLALTGTHVGCEHGVCGACTIFVNGEAVRSCLLFAVQANGQEILTVEALSDNEENLHPIQEAFKRNHALQCGFCTPGLLIVIEEFLREHSHPSEKDIREAIAGNICRCTGYNGIVAAVQEASRLLETKRHADEH